MTARKNATPSLAIIDALDRLTNDIRKNNKEVPDNIVIVLASGNSGRSSVHGHFAPNSWKDEHHEILLGAESLARGAEATLGTLIHELGHAVAQATGVRDTSNHGRYHNTRFKKIGEAMGITLEQAGTIGWSQTTLAPGTAEQYAGGLKQLNESLTTHRVGYQQAAETTVTTPPNKTKAKIDCECNDPVTVSIQWFERRLDGLTCEVCMTEFEMEEL